MTEETRLELSRSTLENSVSIAYAIKHLAPYLYITLPEQSQRSFSDRVKEGYYALHYALLGTMFNMLGNAASLFNKEAREFYQREERSLTTIEEEDRRFFARYGAETQQEKDVCEALCVMGASLRGQNIKSFSLEELSDYLHKNFHEGVRFLNSRYGADAVDTYFQKTAVAWLKEEITKRDHSGPVEILDAVTLQQEGDFFYIKIMDE